MPKGTVKWYDGRKGYGFIKLDDGDTDIFVHNSALEGTTALYEGDKVEFEIVQRSKGPAAIDVEKLES